jgi:hypothetical protein
LTAQGTTPKVQTKQGYGFFLMAKDISWMDVSNLLLTIGSCAIGVFVAFRISSSADDLSQSGLFVSSASLLLEKDVNKQCTGVDIVHWLSKEKHLAPPPWMQPLVRQVLGPAVSTAPTVANIPKGSVTAGCQIAATAGGAAGAADTIDSTTVGSALFEAIGGASPRLYIEIADENQRAGADLLRRSLNGITLDGQAVVAPRIERVGTSPRQLELRFLKKADGHDAQTLGAQLGQLLGSPVSVRDLSANFNDDTKVKERTYELWIPSGFTIPSPHPVGSNL